MAQCQLSIIPVLLADTTHFNVPDSSGNDLTDASFIHSGLDYMLAISLDLSGNQLTPFPGTLLDII